MLEHRVLQEMSQGLLRYYKPKGKPPENYLQGIKGCVPLGRWHSWQQPSLRVPLHQSTQHEEQTGGAVNHFTAEKCWDKPHDWTVTIHGYRLFRRDGRKRGGGLPPTSRSRLSVKSCLWRTAMSRLNACGWKSDTEATKGSKWSVCTTGYLIKGSLLTKPYCFSCRNHCTHRLSSFLGASSTLTSAGKVAHGLAE